MKHYQALQHIFKQIFGYPVQFSSQQHKTPHTGEVLVSNVQRMQDFQTKEQVFSGEVSALVQEIDLLAKTASLSYLGHWKKQVKRVDNYEVLEFQALVLSDYPYAKIQK